MEKRKASGNCANAAVPVGRAVSFHGLFRVLFPESDEVMAVYSTGLKKNTLTYRQALTMILKTVPSVARRLSDLEKGSEVGLCMQDGVRWIAVFWALMMNGYRPVLICPSDGTVAGTGPAVIITGDDISETGRDDCAAIPHESAWADGFFFRTSGEESCRYDIDAARSAVIRAMDMPRGRTDDVKALIAAPLSSPLGLFSLLAIQAMGAVAVLGQEGKAVPISDSARSHDVTHIIAYPYALSSMVARMRRRKEGPFGSGALDKALSSGGLPGKLRYGLLFRHVRTEMTGRSVEVIYSTDDDLNSGVLPFFSRIGYVTGCFSDGSGYRPDSTRIASDLSSGRQVLSEEEVRKGVTRCFAKTLDRRVEEITYTGDFFTSFGGESLDYFVLLSELESAFDVVFTSRDGSRLSSVKTFTRYIMDHQGD